MANRPIPVRLTPRSVIQIASVDAVSKSGSPHAKPRRKMVRRRRSRYMAQASRQPVGEGPPEGAGAASAVAPLASSARAVMPRIILVASGSPDFGEDRSHGRARGGVGDTGHPA